MRGCTTLKSGYPTIANASLKEQAAIWKIHKPKTKNDRVQWHMVSHALMKRTFSASDAKFGIQEEETFGILWESDLFVEGDKDNRTTTQIDAFLAAQHSWLENNLPKGAILLTENSAGNPKLPANTRRYHGPKGKGVKKGMWINPANGRIEDIAFIVEKTLSDKNTTNTSNNAKKPGRPAVSAAGMNLIGEMRTKALHQAITEQTIDDTTTIGLLVLALGAANVSIDNGLYNNYQLRTDIARTLIDNSGRLTNNTNLIREKAKDILGFVLNCRTRCTSGTAALAAGATIAADNFMTNMAKDDFLSCLSKKELETIASSVGVLPSPTARETKKSIIAKFDTDRFLYEGAKFKIPEKTLASLNQEAEKSHETPDNTDTEASFTQPIPANDHLAAALEKTEKNIAEITTGLAIEEKNNTSNEVDEFPLVAA